MVFATQISQKDKQAGVRGKKGKGEREGEGQGGESLELFLDAFFYTFW